MTKKEIMNILYNYVSYPQPRKGIFAVTTDEYKLPQGWVLKEEENTIIGETKDSFVYKLTKLEYGEWIDGVHVEHKAILPLGYHKSRFVRWAPMQLELFS